MFYIIYDANGQISQTLNTSNLLAEEQKQGLNKEGLNVLEMAEGVNTHGKRVNTEKLELEDCPIFAERQRVSAIDAKLRAIDEKKQRALFDGLRNGDWTWYDKHEKEAEALRIERAGK